ncbi:MAG: NAD-dependent epimerase/dehydratase family protein, partial [Novosphingobium sp.]|nr:NAD-dependent epimerase/dehydratase family protein [Novosphingobium sp.]
MPSQHVLLTGPTGFLGSVVLAELLQAGYRVTAAVRHRSENFPPEAQQAVVGDLASCPDWSSALDRIDAVIHLAARAHVLKEDAEDPLSLFRKVNCDATLDLANAAVAAGVEQFVFVSTIGVNGAVTYGAAFGPDDEPNPRSPYAIAKWEAEQGLQEIAGKSRMALTIVRPPLILGDNPKGNLAAMHRMIARGLPLPLRSVTKNHRDFVSRERLSAFVVTALEDKRCHGHT